MPQYATSKRDMVGHIRRVRCDGMRILNRLYCNRNPSAMRLDPLAQQAQPARVTPPGEDRAPGPASAEHPPQDHRRLSKRRRQLTRTRLAHNTNKIELCSTSFESCSMSSGHTTIPKPSGLGMVSWPQHTTGCATEPQKRPAAACFIAGPHRAADGRESSPWSCGT